MLSGIRQRGVTLIEAAIVLALIAVLLVLVVPTATDWLLNSRIRAAAESLLAGMQLARNEAVRRNVPVEFRLDDATKAGWRVCLDAKSINKFVDDVNEKEDLADCDAGYKKISERAAGEGTADVVLAVTPAGALMATFDGLGRLTANVDASASLAQLDVDMPVSVLPAARSRDLRIVVGIGGQILMCDPNVTDTSDVRKCPQ